jgi:hypothetical protein
VTDIILDDVVLRALLGPAGSEDPADAWSWPAQPWWWPEVDEGPVDAVHLHRAVVLETVARGGSIEAARQVRLETMRQLQTGDRVAIGVKPGGKRITIPSSPWNGSGDPAARLWIRAEYPDPDDPDNPYRIYLCKPEWWPGQLETLNHWVAPNGVAERFAGQRLKARGGALTSNAAIARELLAMWHEAGRLGGSAKSIETMRARRA